MSKVYQIITDRIIKALEAGAVPWRKTWSGGQGLPINLKSKKAYRGVNSFLLAVMPYDSPYWLTFKQAKAFGGNVKKGEKSTPVTFYKDWTPEGAPADQKAFPVLCYYSCFNVEQCEGIDEHLPAKAEPKTAFESIEACEAIDRGYVGPSRAKGQPAYSPTLDIVKMPKPEAFDGAAEFYGTLFHELGHSTGHKTRLDRKTIGDCDVVFGSTKYGKEELVAEMTAAFLCAESGIDAPVIENQTAYLASWLKTIRGEPKLVISAAGQAQKAADLILDRFDSKGAIKVPGTPGGTVTVTTTP